MKVVGYVAVNFVPITITFDPDFVEFTANHIVLQMERSLLGSALFGDYYYEENEDEA